MHRRALVPLALAAALAGCGSREPSDEEQVRTVLREFATATAARDYQRLCDRIFAPDLLEGIAKIGLPCEVAMRNSLSGVRNPRLTVGRVDIRGRRATAEVRTSAEGQQPSRDTLGLVKLADGWKVSELSDAGARPAPSPRPAPTAR